MRGAAALRSIARDAYTFAYAMVEHYRTLYEQAVDMNESSRHVVVQGPLAGRLATIM